MTEVVPAPATSSGFMDLLNSGANFFTSYKTAQWAHQDATAARDNAALANSASVTPQADQSSDVSLLDKKVYGQFTYGEAFMAALLVGGLAYAAKKLL